MCELTLAAVGADSVQTAVRQARELALRSPEKWAAALHNLYGEAENDVLFAAMDGDETKAGRVLIKRLREAVIGAATDAAMDAIDDERDADERAAAALDRLIAMPLGGAP